MREFVVTDENLTTMLTTVMAHLDERWRRILAGSTARSVGRGGIAAVAEATGMSRSTVQKAVPEIDAGVEVSVRVRAPGSGRPKAIDAQPGLLLALDDLVEPESLGTRCARCVGQQSRRARWPVSFTLRGSRSPM